jgi:hypothetical protein
MSKTSLTIPTAVENAYILLLGQTTLTISRISAHLLALKITGSYSSEDIFSDIFLLSVSIMMAVNILSGWMSCRDVVSRFNEYSNSLLTIDIVFLLVFFMMNNVLQFSLPASSSGLSASAANNAASAGEIAIRIYSPAIIYLLSVLVAILYLSWNKVFRGIATGEGLAKKVETQLNLRSHNRFLCFSLLLQSILTLLAVIYPAETAVKFICLAFWVVIWLWLNAAWFITTPLKFAISKRG